MRGRLSGALRRTFHALGVRNYRLYFFAQLVSVSGTWMQTVAQAWLVIQLVPASRAGIDLGIVTALQFLPMLLFGSWGGLLADRVDKRRLLYATQSAAGLLALTLGLLTGSGVVRLWHVELLATLLGFVNLVDNPARQTFVSEMVGPERVANAVSLNSVLMNGARMVGPAMAGVLIATVGTAVCFEINAASYLAVLLGLAAMRAGELHRAARVTRGRGQLREGFRYVWRTPVLRDVLLLVAITGTLAYNFQTVLPLLARFSFHGGAGAYSALTSMMAVGAVVGGLVAAGHGRQSVSRLAGIGIVFAAAIALLAACPTLPLAMVAIVPMGAASISFIATANATLQLGSAPEMRGRVMALYAIGFLGSTPLGGPLMGWISQVAGARTALVVAAGGTAAASIAIRWRISRRAPAAQPYVRTSRWPDAADPGAAVPPSAPSPS